MLDLKLMIWAQTTGPERKSRQFLSQPKSVFFLPLLTDGPRAFPALSNGQELALPLLTDRGLFPPFLTDWPMALPAIPDWPMALPALANRQEMAPPTLTGTSSRPSWLTSAGSRPPKPPLELHKQIFKHKLHSTRISGSLEQIRPNGSSIPFSSFLNDQQLFSSLSIKCLFLAVLKRLEESQKSWKLQCNSKCWKISFLPQSGIRFLLKLNISYYFYNLPSAFRNFRIDLGYVFKSFSIHR